MSRYSVKTDNQGRSYICDQNTINDLPLKTGALRDSQVVCRLNRLECINKTLSELGKKLDRRNKRIDTLKASHEKLVKILENLVKAASTNSQIEQNIPWTLKQTYQALEEAEAI